MICIHIGQRVGCHFSIVAYIFFCPFPRVDSALTVKLTDTALSRDLFPNDYHCLGDNENRPVKWLSIEALLDRRFSVGSEVVSNWAYLFPDHIFLINMLNIHFHIANLAYVYCFGIFCFLFEHKDSRINMYSCKVRHNILNNHSCKIMNARFSHRSKQFFYCTRLNLQHFFINNILLHIISFLYFSGPSA